MSQEPMGQTVEMDRGMGVDLGEPVVMGESEPPPSPPAPAPRMDSTSDARVDNNVMRHEYKLLSAEEKQAMQSIKDLGLALHYRIESLGSSREVALAKTKVEEAVMWAVKHITK